MGHAMSGLWHETYARTDLVGYDRPQGPERQKRGISRFFLSAKLDVVCKCRADLILDGMYRVSLWRGATSGNEKRINRARSAGLGRMLHVQPGLAGFGSYNRAWSDLDRTTGLGRILIVNKGWPDLDRTTGLGRILIVKQMWPDLFRTTGLGRIWTVQPGLAGF
jgi:hypothetical protein